jgi:Type I phosphodiesterase / nucleotide pyrophosphatase
VTTVKQICLGVAVAGVVAGAGSAVATGVAYAEPATSDSHSSADAGPAKSSDTAGAPPRKSSRDTVKSARDTDGPRDAAAVSEPRVRRPSTDTETETDTDTETTDRDADGTGSGVGTKSTADARGSDPARQAVPTAGEKVFRTTRTAAVAPVEESSPTTDAGEVAQPVVTSQSSTPAPVPVLAAAAERVIKKPDVLALVPHTPTRSPNRLPLPAPLVPATPASTTSISPAANATTRNRSTTTGDVATQITDPTTQHVLVIGVDGTNLSRILDDPGNAHFFELMNSGTTGASSIAGHTTISNPSWTTILTGVWDTKSGVINNIFTPQTYDTWPTVFNQLEAFNPDIETKAIADWQVIADIAGAGSHRADEIVYIPRGADDPVYAEADAAVTAEAVKSILGTDAGYEDVPNFLFTYVTQVDEAGHLYGGASPEYADAIARTNTNIGLILAAVAAREAATGEDWTVIMTTDHGHQPQQGFGHGFQSPDETSTFVIVDGPDFADGQMNLKYSIADITPTVVSLFGLSPTVDADGVPLTTRGDSQVDPVDLHQALNDAIDMYGYPDIATNVALGVRTIFATIPYYVDGFVTGITTELQAIASQGIFLISDLAALAVFPVQLVGDALYAVTDFIAQIVGRLTGAGVIPPSTSTLQRDSQPYPWVLA